MKNTAFAHRRRSTLAVFACSASLIVGAGCRHRAADEAAVTVPATAVEHLPAECDLAARIDLKSLLSLDAVKGHIAELRGDVPEAPSKGRLVFLDFLKAAEIDPAKDLNEAAVCMRQKPPGPQGEARVGHVIVLAGTLRPGKLLEAILARAPAGQYERVHLAGLEAVRRKGGRLIGQAPDGSILIGDDGDLMAAARDRGKHHLSYALQEGEISLRANRQVLATLGEGHDQKRVHPLAELLGQAEQIDIRLQARESVLRASLSMGSAQQAAQTERRLTDLLAMLKEGPGSARLAQIMPPGTFEALAGTVISRNDRTILLQARLPQSAFGDLFHRVAILGALGT